MTDQLETVNGFVTVKRQAFPRDVGDGVAVDDAGQLRDIIERIGETALSRVRLSGGCRIDAEMYYYLPAEDVLVRESVFIEETKP